MPTQTFARVFGQRLQSAALCQKVGAALKGALASLVLHSSLTFMNSTLESSGLSNRKSSKKLSSSGSNCANCKDKIKFYV